MTKEQQINELETAVNSLNLAITAFNNLAQCRCLNVQILARFLRYRNFSMDFASKLQNEIEKLQNEN